VIKRQIFFRWRRTFLDWLNLNSVHLQAAFASAMGSIFITAVENDTLEGGQPLHDEASLAGRTVPFLCSGRICLVQ
jgi:hypothetical protein